MTFNEALINPPGQLLPVLRHYGVPARNPDAVLRAYKANGDQFLYDVTMAMAGTTPRKSVWSNFQDDNGNEVDGPPTFEQWTQSQSTGEGWQKFFNIWNQALTFVGKTGQTIGGFKNDMTGTSTEPYQYEGTNYGWLYLVGIALVIIILLVLIFKK